MKTSTFKNFRCVSAIALMFLCICGSQARADWASIRGNNRAEHRQIERRHRDIDDDWSKAYYWPAFVPGMTIAALPAGFVQVSAGGTGYDFYDGVYFQPVASLSPGYVVVAPPVGAVVPQLPSGAEPVAESGTTYYYAAGAFYLQEPNGFAVMPAPLGVVVTTLPAGATPVFVKGALYYLAANVYYKPAMLGGATVYTTAHP
jgi:hypothetical protein